MAGVGHGWPGIDARGHARRVLRLEVGYDGTAYRGWQVQREGTTVQGLLLDAVGPLAGEGVRLIGASRTDAGVHALRQTASLAIPAAGPGATLSPHDFARALNARLPPDVRVLSVAEAEEDFDARRRALGKRYAYLIDNAPVPTPLLRRFAWHVAAPLDLAAMREALGALRGRHDFSAYCAAAGRERPPVCTLRAVHVVHRGERSEPHRVHAVPTFEARQPRRPRHVVVLLSADRFLHHMVRNIVGSAVEVGRGARQAPWMAGVLAARDRARAGPTAPAHGLTLLRVLYPGEIASHDLE